MSILRALAASLALAAAAPAAAQTPAELLDRCRLLRTPFASAAEAACTAFLQLPDRPAAERAAAHAARGFHRNAQGERAGAVSDYDLAIGLAPPEPAWLLGRAEVRARLNDLAGARRDEAEAVRIAPDNAEVWAQRAQIRAAREEWRSAVSDYGRALRLQPGNVAWLVERGSVRETMNDLRGALADFTEAIGLAPSEALFAHRARIRERMGDIAEAIADWTAAIAAHGERFNAPLTLARAQARMRAGDLAGAITDQDAILQRDRTDAVALADRCIARARLVSPEAGQADCAAALAAPAGPDAAYPSVAAAALAILAGDRTGATARIEAGLAADPASAALADLRRVLELRPGQRLRPANAESGAPLERLLGPSIIGR